VFQASTTQENINTAGDDMREVVQDLLHMLEDSVSQAGEVTTMIDKISKSITKVCPTKSVNLLPRYVLHNQ